MIRSDDYVPLPINLGSAAGGFGTGDRYWYRKFFKLIPGFDLDRVGWTQKTTPLKPRAGNTPLTARHEPVETFPKSIEISFFGKYALNAVGLTCWGAEATLNDFLDEYLNAPMSFSFMALENTQDGQAGETKEYLEIFERRFGKRTKNIGHQDNMSCPNAGKDLDKLADSLAARLDVYARFRRKAFIKINALMPVQPFRDLQKHDAFAGIIMGNTLPYGELSERINWKGIFGGESPVGNRLPKILGADGIERPQNGGLSGSHLVDIHCDWIRRARDWSVRCHIQGLGGISHPTHVRKYADAQASSSGICSAIFYAPWMIKACAEEAYAIDAMGGFFRD